MFERTGYRRDPNRFEVLSLLRLAKWGCTRKGVDSMNVSIYTSNPSYITYIWIQSGCRKSCTTLYMYIIYVFYIMLYIIIGTLGGARLPPFINMNPSKFEQQPVCQSDLDKLRSTSSSMFH